MNVFRDVRLSTLSTKGNRKYTILYDRRLSVVQYYLVHFEEFTNTNCRVYRKRVYSRYKNKNQKP